MLYIDPTPHPFFKNFAHYVAEKAQCPIEISKDYSKEGIWVLNFVSFKNGVHKLVKDYIVVQTENLAVYTGEYEKFVRGAMDVWDGSTNWKIGYADHWRLQMEEAKDIDILFYGMMNDRREKIFKKIEEVAKITIVEGYDVMKYVMRAKIVLSVHYYHNHINDMARVAPLLSNKAFVLAEKGRDEWYNNGGLFTETETGLPKSVKHFLGHPLERIKWQDKGYEWVKNLK